MNDSSSSSSNTEIPGQMSFADMMNDSESEFPAVTGYEIVVLIHDLAAILQRHLEQNHADS